MSSQFFIFSGFYCRLLGTPNEEVWPGVSKLMNWHEYPQWSPQNLSTSVPNLDKDGLDLLAVSWLLIIWRWLKFKMFIFIWWLTLAWHLCFAANVAVWALKADLSKESYGTSLLWWSEQGLSLNRAMWMRNLILACNRSSLANCVSASLKHTSSHVNCVCSTKNLF